MVESTRWLVLIKQLTKPYTHYWLRNRNRLNRLKTLRLMLSRLIYRGRKHSLTLRESNSKDDKSYRYFNEINLQSQSSPFNHINISFSFTLPHITCLIYSDFSIYLDFSLLSFPSLYLTFYHSSQLNHQWFVFINFIVIEFVFKISIIYASFVINSLIIGF